jgi:hypothetical protein
VELYFHSPIRLHSVVLSKHRDDFIPFSVTDSVDSLEKLHAVAMLFYSILKFVQNVKTLH